MAKESRKRIKTYFQTGDQPTENEFINVFDSTLNLSGSNAITGSLIISGSTSDNADGSAPNLHVMGDITSSGNILALGDVIARNYIVSSSVTNITTQTMSGSTEFGNSTDDTHQFTGHITASGNISASGDVYASNIIVPGGGRISFDDDDTTDQFIKGDDHNITIDGDDIIKLKADTAVNFVEDSGNVNVSINPNSGHITASGNISASGLISAPQIFAGGSSAIPPEISLQVQKDLWITEDIANVTNIKATGNITASGNISSSGNVYADKYHSNGYNLLRYKSNTDKVLIGNSAKETNILGLSLTLGDTSGFHVTASGNISASGNIIGTNLIADSASFSTRTTTLEGNGVFTSAIISGSFTAPSASFSTRVTLNDAKVTNSDQSLVHLAVTSSNVLFGNITASGNISSSGAITSNTLNVNGSQIDFTGLPTSDPGIVGRLYRTGADIKISV